MGTVSLTVTTIILFLWRSYGLALHFIARIIIFASACKHNLEYSDSDTWLYSLASVRPSTKSITVKLTFRRGFLSSCLNIHLTTLRKSWFDDSIIEGENINLKSLADIISLLIISGLNGVTPSQHNIFLWTICCIDASCFASASVAVALVTPKYLSINEYPVLEINANFITNECIRWPRLTFLGLSTCSSRVRRVSIFVSSESLYTWLRSIMGVSGRNFPLKINDPNDVHDNISKSQ